MNCPLCEKHEVFHSPNRLAHYLRLLFGSHKYYCSACGHKWRARPRFGRKTSFVFFPILVIVSLVTFKTVDILSEKWRDFSSENSGIMEIAKDPVLADKLMRAGSDPSVLKSLTSSEKQKLHGLKNAMMKSKDSSGIQGLASALIGDATLAKKLIDSKGNREALKNLSPAEKQKLKEIKSRLSASEIQEIKSQFGR